MASVTTTLNRAFHAALDAALRIDRGGTLNLEPKHTTPGGPDMAERIRLAVAGMAAEAFESSTGAIDYNHLSQSDAAELLRRCTAELASFDPSVLTSRDERLAFWINLYNALIVDAVISFRPRSSVREDNGFFRRAAYLIGHRRYSADDIEHGILRGNRHHPLPLIPFPQFAAGDPRLAYSITPVDPRIHFALNCASRSCPPLVVYEAANLDTQLDLAASAFINGGSVSFAPGKSKLLLSRIFRWYERDFGDRQGVVAFILRHLDDKDLRGALTGPLTLSIGYQPYDWSLNRI